MHVTKIKCSVRFAAFGIDINIIQYLESKLWMFCSIDDPLTYARAYY